MIRDSKYPFLIKPNETEQEYQKITPEDAGWKDLNFAARKLRRGETWNSNTQGNETAIIILGGIASIISSNGTWEKIGRRKDVFSGMPFAVYLSINTEFSVTAESDELDIAYGWCSSQNEYPARLITPEKVSIEIRGGGNATRQINNIIPPGFECDRIVAVEVFTPSGNWSSYPPHKHDEHREDEHGNILEACLEETYFYKVDRKEGFGIQRIYTSDKEIDEIAVAKNNDVVLVPKGYHPVSAAHGYNIYYLNFLAGSAQSLANYDDPEHAWIKDTWHELDSRVPVVSLEMENITRKNNAD
ncbi:MAG: 5-deoxy-glucuronate isomerase [Melioribacteraceae bacterium]|nr:5-deoxy-glucuronate isomerase [Melioribacteraceae bacterium]